MFLDSSRRIRVLSGCTAALALLVFSTLSCPGDAARDRAGLWSWWWLHERFEPETALLFIGIIAWALWRDRGRSYSTEPARGWWWWGGGGLALQLVGARLYEPTLCAVGLLVSIAALVGGFGGGERLRRIPGAVILIFLTIPTLFDPLIYPLQRLATGILELLFGTFGWQIYAHGTLLRLYDGMGTPAYFEIADACSGITGIRACIGIFAAFHLLWPTRDEVSVTRLVVAGIGCGITVNLLRLILITVVGYWAGMRWGMIFHDTVAGYLAFFPVLIFFLLMDLPFRRSGP
jgi:exosortase